VRFTHFAAAALATSVLLPSAPLRADTYPKNHDVDIQHYRFELELFDGERRIDGQATIEVAVRSEQTDALAFDLISQAPTAADSNDVSGMAVESVRVRIGTTDPVSVAFVHEGDRLHVPLPEAASPDDRRAGQRITVEIDYAGTPRDALGIGPNKHGTWSWFSDNWPNKARHWLPTVDHPYDKASSEMIVIAPSRYQAVSNGLLIEETDLGDGRRRTHWRQSVPIATWLNTLGVTRFAVQHLKPFDGKPVQTWVFAEDRDAGFYDFAEPTHRVLDFYSEWVGPFAYEKLANVVSARTKGGMEAATAIMYDDRSVTGERSQRWRNVVIHEIAHQWFGNAVTEADWDDVWLSEGFATYFTLLFIEHAYGRDAFVEGLLSSRERVFAAYAERPDERIIHDDLDDMSRVTSGNTYQKGAWTLHMLRSWLGDDVFWRGIREYYATYRDANCTTADFRRVMERVSGEDLEWFFDQWLRRAGALQVDWSQRWDPSTGVLSLELHQTQPQEPYRARLPVTVRWLDDDSVEQSLEQVVWIEQRVESVELQLPAAPLGVVLDAPTTVLMQANQRHQQPGGGSVD
jgi:aminopeptidase N